MNIKPGNPATSQLSLVLTMHNRERGSFSLWWLKLTFLSLAIFKYTNRLYCTFSPSSLSSLPSFLIFILDSFFLVVGSPPHSDLSFLPLSFWRKLFMYLHMFSTRVLVLTGVRTAPALSSRTTHSKIHDCHLKHSANLPFLVLMCYPRMSYSLCTVKPRQER